MVEVILGPFDGLEFPEEFELQIIANYNVGNIHDLEDYTNALLSIEDIYREYFPFATVNVLAPAKKNCKYSYGFYKHVPAKIKILRIQSPPELNVFVDPAWLSVLISVVAGYKEIKAGSAEIQTDVGELIDMVGGLTGDVRIQVEVGVRIMLAVLAQNIGEGSRRLAKKCDDVQKVLINGKSRPPRIKVIPKNPNK